MLFAQRGLIRALYRFVSLSVGENGMKSMRALSIHQPYAEQILRGKKKFEYRADLRTFESEFISTLVSHPAILKIGKK